ncbi:MAG: homocysteine S-methyltransferase family protein [Thiotrichales bacterium]|jgi:homocysteine S-methyltransferase|nr:homocysteine S-methyltransferase family protein [Thiotrichales bacterium]MBT3854831.1 homocysteine S-methyltransferase family protein [Thiotrichales bacterium]MBT4654194.1 homocysteine S-methyltransferase family protein [Thiotrichales bacterium]MBT5500327.1 homocysteine S-methyltransferase family protein [Thiotrichales bacterium]MBT5983977.1 homocysteine S-methyltransferase family protein [Thiotrichales bacterium]
MNIDFFKKTRILDGGMGQELLARGMEPNGTLWSANALLQEKYHQLLLDTHLDFIKSGAEVIVTATFTTRRLRLRDNNVEDKFEYLNTKAGEIAKKAKDLNPHILVAGGLPPQYLTYESDTRPDGEIKENFHEQAKLLSPFVDFFYFDVLSSVREIQLAIEAIITFNKPYLIGAHISEGVKLPSGEKISDIIYKIKHKNLLGLMLSCVSPENYEQNLDEIKNLGVPFGFKLNGFVTTKPKAGYTSTFNKSKTGNPNEFLGQREDLTPEKMSKFVKTFKEAGATILGGCCETRPTHIMEMAKLK